MKKQPTYTSSNLLPESQLCLLADAEELGSLLPQCCFGAISDDEQTLLDSGWLRIKTVRGLTKLCITSLGLKVAPKRRALMYRWERFCAVAPLVGLAIEQNTNEAFADAGMNSLTCPLSVLVANCGLIGSAEDTFGEGYPDEVAALREAGLI